jgi:hypothetical protein
MCAHVRERENERDRDRKEAWQKSAQGTLGNPGAQERQLTRIALTDLAFSSRAGDPRGLLSLAGDERRRDPLLSLRGERLLSLSLLGERLLQKRKSGVQE